ncbi:helix-turn-helix transcriptional regulator [Sphingobium sp. C100]|uniref:helix-turn-helix transcriptional regulator n=1 Tax=Sphingobium sp. C100 TaxID=1207055 RepID=UPI001F2782D8|nr:helix-turn-helix domain-containing protein [Sphingobium sp. C100]
MSAMTQDETAPHYLDNAEAAAFLKLSPRTLEKQRVRGGGPAFRKFGRRVVYALSDLQSWADQRRYNSTTQAELAARG